MNKVCQTVEQMFDKKIPFTGYGALAASRSAESVVLANKLDFKSEGDELWVSRNVAGRPTIKLTSHLEQTATPRTAWSCAVDPKGTSTSHDFEIGKFLMGGYEFKSREFETFCKDYNDYLAAAYNEYGVLNIGSDSQSYLNKFGAAGHFKKEFATSVKSKLLNPINSYIVTKLAAGLNPVTGLTTPTTTAFKNASGQLVTDFLEQIMQLKMATGYMGRYKVLAGLKAAGTLAKECGLPAGIYCCSQLGINGEALLNSLPIEFYYDKDVDAIYGSGAIIVAEQDSFALKTFTDLLPDGSWCCEEYGNMNFQVSENCNANFALPLEVFTSKKGLCDNNGNGVSMNIYWYLKYDVYTRPYNLTSGSADTGIYHYLLQ